MSGTRRLAVVVVTWNGREDALRCLRSLPPEIGPEDAILLADNGSTDGTAEAVRKAWPGVEVIENGRNLGYAGGANVGLRRALEGGFRWALLLNQDTEVREGSVRTLLSEGEARPEAAALQPLLVSARDPRRVDSLGIRVLASVGAQDEGAGSCTADVPVSVRPVFGACGAAVLLRVEALREVGLLDEGLHLLLEDVDLAFRLRAAGREALLVPSAHVLHRRGISGAGRTEDEARLRRYLLHRNLAALALRWWPPASLRRSAAVIAAQCAQALALRSAAPEHPCLPLWRRFRSARRASRRAMVERGVDRWFA